MKRGTFTGILAAMFGAPLVTLTPKRQQEQSEIDKLMAQADEMDILSWDRMGVCQSIRLGFPGGMLTNSESKSSVIIARQKDLTWKIIGPRKRKKKQLA